jgi:hypothetical protein
MMKKIKLFRTTIFLPAELLLYLLKLPEKLLWTVENLRGIRRFLIIVFLMKIRNIKRDKSVKPLAEDTIFITIHANVMFEEDYKRNNQDYNKFFAPTEGVYHSHLVKESNVNSEVSELDLKVLNHFLLNYKVC